MVHNDSWDQEKLPDPQARALYIEIWQLIYHNQGTVQFAAEWDFIPVQDGLAEVIGPITG